MTMECEEIEEIDMSAGANNHIIIPPTQFMDFSQVGTSYSHYLMSSVI